MGYIFLSWPKVSHGNPQTMWSVAKTIGFSSQTHGKAPLLETISTQHIELGAVKVVPIQSSPIGTRVCGTGRSSECYKKININTNLATNLLI